MTIKQIEEQLQVTRANVRFYEKEGLLFPRRNPLNGYREYSAEDVETLRKILFFRSLEVPIEKIRLYKEGKLGLHGILEAQVRKLQEEQETALQMKVCAKSCWSKRSRALLPSPFPGRWMTDP